MNYKPVILKKIEELAKVTPDYSFAELLYSILRKKNLSSRPEGVNLHWLLNINDDDILSAVENTLVEEIEFIKEDAS